MTREIHAAIVGNPQMGHVGLAQEVRSHRERLDAIDRKFWRVSGALAGLGLAWEAFKTWATEHLKTP